MIPFPCGSVSGLHFHVIGEGVVRVRSQRAERVYDKENYIDFRMRLLGEPGNEKKLHYGTFNVAVKSKRPRCSSDNKAWAMSLRQETAY